MECQVKVDSKGNVVDVLATNGKKSSTFESLTDLISRMKDKTDLQNQFKDWVGKHINNNTSDKELALGAYKQLYSPMFKDWFGDWTKVAEAVSKKDQIKGYFKFAFDIDPQKFLYEIASQANSSESERMGAIGATSEDMVRIAQELFPTAKGSTAESVSTYSPLIGQTDINGEPLLLNNSFSNANGDQRNILNQNVNSQPSQSLYQLTGSSAETTPSKASRETIATIKEFLNRVGVKLESVANIVVDGQKVDASGMADAMNRLVQVVGGKEDVALPEEAFHIATEIIQQKDPALFKQMMNQVSKYNMYDKVLQTYRNVYTTPDGKPDIPKIKKETVAKILAETFIRNNQEVVERPDLLVQTKSWWKKVLESLKYFFLRTGMNVFKEDPFHMGIGVIKDENATYDSSKITPDEGAFMQKDQKESVADKIIRVNKNLVKTDDGYELNGKKVKSGEDTLAKTEEGRKKSRFEAQAGEQTKSDRAFTKATEGVIKTDLSDIFTRYINDEGNIRETPLQKVGRSAIDPNDETFYTALEENVQDRLGSYPEGTKFFHDVNIYNEGSNTATTVDFIAVKPNGKVDVLQFKAPEIKGNESDVNSFKQSQYNAEMEQTRQILERGYGIKKADFDKTRTVPIKADYSRVIPNDLRSPLSKITGLRIGNVDVKLVKDDVLLPIPSTSEVTGIRKFDDLIAKLRGLLKKTQDKYDPSVSSLERGQTIANLYNAIKKLQVQRNTTALISSAKTINIRQQERLVRLSRVVDELDPATATEAQMSEIANKILEDKDEAEIYAHMDDALHKIFNDGSPESNKILSEAASVAQTARNVSDDLFELSKKMQTQKLAAKVGIEDEFNPEKQLTWYRRMIRSLSQSHSTAGKLLWKLVQNINNSFHIQFQDRLTELGKLHDQVNEWMKGKSLNDLYHKFFQFDSKDRWTGKTIKKYDPKFYENLTTAKEEGNTKWVKDNIDMKKYDEWFQRTWREMAEQVKTARYNEDDVINEQLKYNKMNQWLEQYSPDKGFVNIYNARLKEFPLDKHFSKEYTELLKPENKAVLDLYNHWHKRLKESVDNSMIEEHNGWAWFPNVRNNWLEKLSSGRSTGWFKDFLLGNTRIDAEDEEFGKIDPLTQKAVNEVHANYVTDLVQRAEDMDGNYWDASGKSMDIFKVLSLWDREILKFNLKTEAEGLAKMLLFTEQNRKSLRVGRSGKLSRNKEGVPIEDDNNEKNAQYLQDHIEAMLYGKNTSNESNFVLNIPTKAIAEKINKLAGRKIVDVPEEESVPISGVKGLAFLNRWFALKTLGLNVLSAASNLFGGTFNAYLNQGKYFNKAELAKAEIDMVAAKFYGTPQATKLAGFLAYLQPYVEDKTGEQTRHMSVSNAVKYFSSDWLMKGMRLSDNVVNQHIAIAFINGAMFRDGKIQIIRNVAREELDHEHLKYPEGGTSQDTKEWNKKFEARVEELRKSPEALLNIAEIKDDKLELPGINLHDPKKTPQTVTDFRNIMIETIKDALGNTSREDLSLYKRSVIYQSVAMFKNWIPRMVDVRGQSLRYNAGTNQYEWGRMRMLGDALMNNFTGTVAGLFKSLGGNDDTLVNIAKKSYVKMRENREKEQEDFNITEAAYIDMYTKGVAAQFKEMGLAAAFIGVLIAARLNSPDLDEDPTLKGSYKWMLRGLDKLQDEVSFFYNPQSFSDMVNGSIFPAASLLLDAQRFSGAMIAKGFYSILGDDQKAGAQHPGKYLFRMFPITKELLNYMAIMDTDLAKKWDLRVSSRNGSSR